MKIAFVVPWYGEIPDCAESECKNVAENLSRNGIEVEILTTCVKEFNSDWSSNYYEEGVSQLNNIITRRSKVRQRNTGFFDRVNSKLMHNQKISAKEEQIYIEEMIYSNYLYRYLETHGSDYDYFLFIPYMFGTAYYGSQIHPKKSFLIPCLHDECYAYMDIYKNMFQNVAGLIFHAEPEAKLANSRYTQLELNNLGFKNTEIFPLLLDFNVYNKRLKYFERSTMKNLLKEYIQKVI